MIEGEITGQEEVEKALKGIGKDATAKSRKIMTIHSRLMQSQMRDKYMSGAALNVRSGNLRSSVRPLSVSESGDEINAGISIGTKYARVHIGPKGQKTTIHPVNKQWLTIPLDAAKTPAGVTRKSATQWENTFFARSKKNNLILFQNRGKDKIVPLFVLKKQVELKSKIHPEDLISWIKPAVTAAFEQADIH